MKRIPWNGLRFAPNSLISSNALTFSMLFKVLDSLNQSQCLVNASANRQVVDSLLAHHSFRIDDEQTAQGDALLLDQHIVVGRNGFGDVGQ